jgi:hypothetical protein
VLYVSVIEKTWKKLWSLLNKPGLVSLSLFGKRTQSHSKKA